jgi:hypothetical protein
MEKLSETQRQRLVKMSDLRLARKLMQAGMSEEQVEKMDR